MILGYSTAPLLPEEGLHGCRAGDVIEAPCYARMHACQPIARRPAHGQSLESTGRQLPVQGDQGMLAHACLNSQAVSGPDFPLLGAAEACQAELAKCHSPVSCARMRWLRSHRQR